MFLTRIVAHRDAEDYNPICFLLELLPNPLIPLVLLQSMVLHLPATQCTHLAHECPTKIGGWRMNPFMCLSLLILKYVTTCIYSKFSNCKHMTESCARTRHACASGS